MSVLSLALAAKGQTSLFTSETIPDSIWARMQGKSYLPNPHIHRQDLRYLRVSHYDKDGKTHTGELICNRLIAQKLLNIFRELYNHRYPIERMQLPDVYGADDERQMQANNTSCFCYRNVSGSGKLSTHAKGLAIDINPLYNPYVKRGKDGKWIVRPSHARKYTDRSLAFPYKLEKGDICYRLFIQNGFQWGGSWRSLKDYQHFEYQP